MPVISIALGDVRESLAEVVQVLTAWSNTTSTAIYFPDEPGREQADEVCQVAATVETVSSGQYSGISSIVE